MAASMTSSIHESKTSTHATTTARTQTTLVFNLMLDLGMDMDEHLVVTTVHPGGQVTPFLILFFLHVMMCSSAAY
jgi:hypothetical protein